MNEGFINSAVAWVTSQLELSTGSEDPTLAARVAVLREAFHADATGLLGGIDLSSTEKAVLLTLLSAELDPQADAMLRTIHPSRRSAVRRFVYGPGASLKAQQELSPQGALFRFALLCESSKDGDADLRVARRVINHLLGDGATDSILDGCINVRANVQLGDVTASAANVQQLMQALKGPSAVIVLSGRASCGRSTLLAAAAQESGRRTLEVDARRMARDPAMFLGQIRAIARECRLLGSTPLLSNVDALSDSTERLQRLALELESLVEGPILLTCAAQPSTIRWRRPPIVVDLDNPTTAQRASLWHSALGQGTAEDAQLLAEQYPLAPALIVRASEAAKARANGRALEPDDIYAGIRSVLDDRLGQFAKRVTVTQTWDDLVLPPDQLDTITELMARVRGRSKVYEQWGFAAKVGKGLGVSALFSGPPGTGKTMVAALIARDLGLELYQVDMGKLVSKFIGETEKNLGALFDAAEAGHAILLFDAAESGHAILLFDEADSLFGKRTDVKSSNDRYANLETNYLLQRLESFTGICLLTTNHDSHIDPAFQRRLSLHLRFELPDVEERALLWRATLPVVAPLASNVDFGSLARRFAMSGGYIRNAALRAAFLAADEDSEITAAHLERAARVEYEGMGKIAA